MELSFDSYYVSLLSRYSGNGERPGSKLRTKRLE